MCISYTARKMSYAAKKLDGKVAIITASTDGIGYAIAERLAKEGAKVVISSRKQSNVDTALNKLKSQGLDVSGVVCHAANPADRQKLYNEAISKYGGIDILVSNAGANPSVEGVLDCDEGRWDKIFDVNVKASFMLAKEVRPYLRKRGGGKIVFMSSASVYHPFPLLGAYVASKAALLGLTRSASLHLASENINVNCVAPGIIDTKFAGVLTGEDDSLKKIPLNRFGQPQDVSGTVAFLVSDDANYITRQTIVPDGGMSSRL